MGEGSITGVQPTTPLSPLFLLPFQDWVILFWGNHGEQQGKALWHSTDQGPHCVTWMEGKGFLLSSPLLQPMGEVGARELRWSWSEEGIEASPCLLILPRTRWQQAASSPWRVILITGRCEEHFPTAQLMGKHTDVCSPGRNSQKNGLHHVGRSYFSPGTTIFVSGETAGTHVHLWFLTGKLRFSW